MRWLENKPNNGDVRLERRFMTFPRKMLNAQGRMEWRWLEFAEIVCVYDASEWRYIRWWDGESDDAGFAEFNRQRDVRYRVLDFFTACGRLWQKGAEVPGVVFWPDLWERLEADGRVRKLIGVPRSTNRPVVMAEPKAWCRCVRDLREGDS